MTYILVNLKIRFGQSWSLFPWSTLSRGFKSTGLCWFLSCISDSSWTIFLRGSFSHSWPLKVELNKEPESAFILFFMCFMQTTKRNHWLYLQSFPSAQLSPWSKLPTLAWVIALTHLSLHYHSAVIYYQENDLSYLFKMLGQTTLLTCQNPPMMPHFTQEKPNSLPWPAKSSVILPCSLCLWLHLCHCLLSPLHSRHTTLRSPGTSQLEYYYSVCSLCLDKSCSSLPQLRQVFIQKSPC